MAARPLPPIATRSRCPTGWMALDERLGGGWPVGLVEVFGRGRSSLGLGTAGAAQAAGLAVAWVDGPGAFCPATARVDLARLTLVQPARVQAERRVLSEIGPAGARSPRRRGPTSLALFAADTLLRSRAFGLVVLDLLPAPREPATWFRLARLAASASTLLLLLQPGPRPVGGSAASLALRVELRPAESPPWADPPPAALAVQVQRHRRSPGRDEPLVLPAEPACAAPSPWRAAGAGG